MVWDRAMTWFGRRLAIDLGAVNTWIYSPGRGIILNEPSAIAINRFTREVMAVGREAHMILGREPRDMIVHRPMENGVVADYGLTEHMLKVFLQRAGLGRYWPRMRLEAIIGIPGSATHVERRALTAAVEQAGVSRVLLVEEGVAAAIGAGALSQDSQARLVVNIGGGTANICIISSAGVISSHSINVAGLAMDRAIQEYVRRRYKLLIGERSAEAVKIELGLAVPSAQDRASQVVGSGLIDNSPQEISLRGHEVAEALDRPIGTIIDRVQRAMSEAPPEIAIDLVETGIVLSGGGSLLSGLDTRLREALRLPVARAERPAEAVVLEAGHLLEHRVLLQRFQVNEEIPSWEFETAAALLGAT